MRQLYCKVGQLLQKKSVYLREMETHGDRQGQCGLRTELCGILIFGGLSRKQFLLMFVFRGLKFIRFNKV